MNYEKLEGIDGKTIKEVRYYGVVDNVTIVFTDGTCVGFNEHNPDVTPMIHEE